MDTVGDANEHSSWASSVNSQKNYVPRRNISLTPHSMISGTVTVIKLHAAQPHNKLPLVVGNKQNLTCLMEVFYVNSVVVSNPLAVGNRM